MNPATPQLPATASASQFSPTSSPLYPPAVQHNARILSSLATLSACFSGLVAGILGLTNLSGFFLYLATALLTALTIGLTKCRLDIPPYVAQAHGSAAAMAALQPGAAVGAGAGGAGGATAGVSVWRGWAALMGLGQENLLGFLLFWIGSYALIHADRLVYD